MATLWLALAKLLLRPATFNAKKTTIFLVKPTATAAFRQVSLAKARLQVTSCIPSSCSSGQLPKMKLIGNGVLKPPGEKKRFLSDVVKMDERGFTRKVNLAWPLGHKTMELKQNDGEIPVYSLNGSTVLHSYPFDPRF